ncbi:MAG: hypothetical protein COB26_02895 [Piscirickettsiaceae bacterium]|nr:MAG: hypothetical protein COB26_02895 [Piscirickettsiaceae bacterium]
MASIRESLAWSLLERHLAQVITLISSMVLARLLSPTEVGIFSICAAFLAIATIFRDFGVSEYLIQEKELSKDKISGAYALTIATAWSMALLLFLSRHAIANFYNEPALINVLSVLTLNFLILPISAPSFAIMNREMDFKHIFVIQILTNLIHASTSITLAFMGYSFMSLAWASVISIMVQTILVTYFRPSYAAVFPNIKNIKHIWRFGLTFSSSRAVEMLTSNVHEFIIGRQFGFEALGIFSRAIGLVNLFKQTVTSAITRVAAPSFASTFHNSNRSLISAYTKVVANFTVIAWPFYAFIGIESENIILLLFGHQWVAAAPIASVLVIGSMISCTFALAPNALIAMGKVKTRLIINILIAPVHIIAITIASAFDLIAVAMMWAITWSVALLLYNFYLSKTLQFTYKHLIKSTSKSIIVTILVVGSILVSNHFLTAMNLHILLTLCIEAFIVFTTWLLSVFIAKHKISEELIKIKSNLFSKKAA